MKRVLSLALALMMCLSLCACSDDGFDTEYSAIIERIETLNSNTSKITYSIYDMWKVIGPDDILLLFAGLCTMTEGRELSNFDDDDYLLLAMAACCLYPDEYWNDTSEYAFARNTPNAQKKLKRDDEEAQKVLNSAIAFTSALSSLISEDNALTEDMKVFEEKFGKKHKEEVSNLNDWLLDSSMYIELATSPSGSLREYVKSITTYETNLTRFSKIANN